MKSTRQQVEDARWMAELIEHAVYLFSNGTLAAQGSTLATNLYEAGLTVTYVAKPINHLACE